MRTGMPGGLSLAVTVVGLLAVSGALTLRAQPRPRSSSLPYSRTSSKSAAPHLALVDEYCLSCHDEDHEEGRTRARHDRGGRRRPGIRRCGRRSSGSCARGRCRRSGKPRPDEAHLRRGGRVARRRRSTARPRRIPIPGRTDTFRRLNRTEYQNAIRDLLALDVDVAALLPSDESSHGFDNVTVGDLSPTLLERYVAAAQKISRLAVGQPEPLARRRHRILLRRTSRRRSTSTGCRSARAAAR